MSGGANAKDFRGTARLLPIQLSYAAAICHTLV